jgi:Na+-driven multidrug efflux pump
MFHFGRQLYANVMKMALPVVATECGWALSFALIFAAYGRLGTSALAVSQVVNVVCDMLQSFFFAVGNATAMLIGETLGQGHKDRAYRYGKHAFLVVMILNVIMTIVMMLLAKPIAGVYDFDHSTTELLIKAIMAQALVLTPKMLAYMPIVGILRAGGDTLFCMIVDLTADYAIQVPMAFFVVLALHWSLPAAIIMVALGDVVRICVCLPRFLSRKWINVVA